MHDLPTTTGKPSPSPAGTEAEGQASPVPAVPDSATTTHAVAGPAAPAGKAPGSLPELPGYEVLEEIGQGGMGVVYRARQTALKRVVALKMLRPGTEAGPEEMVRFRTEAEAAAHLQHPNIVQVYEVGEHRGLPFFSLEYCAGGSLAAHLDGTPAPARPAAELLRTLAQAIQHAHEKGVIHRDLKPSNVLLQQTNRPDAPSIPKIGDFGLAKRQDDDSQRTRTGVILGTASYMPPEQAQGKAGQVGPLSDVYGLGAILYELLTGRPPFKGATMLDTLVQVRTEDPVPPRRRNPRVPRDLETICLKCLHKEPRRRYTSAGELADDLGRFLEHEPIRARPVGTLERAAWWVRRRPAVVLALLLVVLALGSAGAGWWLWGRWQEGRRQAAERERALAEAAVVEIEFFGGVVRRNGEPEGIQPLPEEQARQRDRAYKVYRRGGKVERIDLLHNAPRWYRLAAVNDPAWHALHLPQQGRSGRDALVALLDGWTAAARPNAPASLHFHRDEAGRLLGEEAHDAGGQILWDLRHLSIDRALYNPSGAADGEKSLVEFAWNAAGLVAEIRRADVERPTAPDDGVAGLKLEHDDRGLCVRCVCVDRQGRPAASKDGFALRTSRHDAGANPVEEAYFGPDGSPVLSRAGQTRITRKYDAVGRLAEETFWTLDRRTGREVGSRIWGTDDVHEHAEFTADGMPTVDDKGVHHWVGRFDDRGNIVEGSYFGTDGRPVVSKLGYARQTWTYDSRGRQTETAFWVLDGKGDYVLSLRRDGQQHILEQASFAANGKPTVYTQGYHRQKNRLDDRGNLVEQTYFGIEGKPVVVPAGFHRANLRYDGNGRPVEQTVFGIDGKPVLHTDGHHRAVFRYNDRGQKVEETYFDTHGKPARHKTHDHRWTIRYDEMGREIEQAFWVLDARGDYVLSRRLDGQGHVLEQASFGADGRPTLDAEGCHRRVSHYDEHGHRTELLHFGTDGKPVDSPRGFPHRVVMRHDGRGRQIEQVYFDSQGKPARHREGDHRWTARHDEHGHEIERSFFGLDGKPVVILSGYARVTRSYDPDGHLAEQVFSVLDLKGNYALSRRLDGKGNVLEQAYFAHDGRPSFHRGYHRTTRRFDEQGRQVEQAYFDADGKPVRDEAGVHRWTATFDGRGHQVEAAFYDVDGKTARQTAENHRWTVRYDERGNQIETRWFGVDDKPGLHQDGMHRRSSRYDENNRLIEQSAFDVDGKPVILKAGYARQTWTYDGGVLTEQAFWVPDGKGGYAVSRRLNGRGVLLEEAAFAADGRPTLFPTGSYHRYIAEYDQAVRQTAIAYFGTDDRPVALRAGGYHRQTTRYDDQGRVAEQAYFGADGKPVLTRGGYHRWTANFDARGNQIERVYLGIDGKPIVIRDGYCRYVSRYDEEGRQVEEAYFGLDDRPARYRGGYHKLTRRYGADGELSGMTAADDWGKPLRLEAFIQGIEEEGEAASVGLQVGDVLLAYGGKEVYSLPEFEQARRSAQTPDGPGELKVLRQGRTVAVSLPPGDLGMTLGFRVAPAATEK